MKSERNLFWIFIGVSVALHIFVFLLGKYHREEAKYSLLKAPNTVQVNIVEEFIPKPTKIEELITKQKTAPIEKIITTKETIPPSIVIQEKQPISNVKENLQKSYLNKEKKIEEKQKEQTSKISEKSQGTIIEARPLAHENATPNYPRLAEKRGWEGDVRVKIYVNTLGDVDKIILVESSGYQVLDRSALKILKTWKFEPEQINGKAIPSWQRFKFDFHFTK